MQHSQQKQFIAVNEQIDTAGAIVWWRLGGDVPAFRLATLWGQAGLDENDLPSTPSPETALYRASQEQKGPRTLVRPLKGEGYAIVAEIADEQDVTHVTKATVFLTDDKSDVKVVSEDGRYYESISADFRKHLTQLSASDVSQWLIRLLHLLGATSLRDRGGIYFVPRTVTERWDTIVKVLREASGHTFFCVPALRSEEAVAAILDAVEREAQAMAEAIREELAKGSDEGLGARALRNRERKLAEMDQKLARYEELLGKKSESFHQLIEEVSAGVTVALLALESEEQAS